MPEEIQQFGEHAHRITVPVMVRAEYARVLSGFIDEHKMCVLIGVRRARSDVCDFTPGTCTGDFTYCSAKDEDIIGGT